ncbi:MAG TPA: hypothetical protein PKW49_07415 [Paludibacteraceae bacterium]|jgi:hypothetical protein|nr:hypothetical protein [Paludibacteraceae bacterium]HQF50251.1 hypothetical protein [Paludibacteraceae bacterium]
MIYVIKDLAKAKGLRDHYNIIVDEDDGILVLQVDGVPQWAGLNLDGNPIEL